MTSKVSQGLFHEDHKDVYRRFVDDIWANRAGVLYATKSHDFASTADAAGLTTTVTVPGAELGDFVLVSHEVDLVGVTLTGYVSAADTVSVRFQNESGSAVDLGAARTLRVAVIPRRSVKAVFGPNVLFGSATVDVASLADGAGATSSGITVTGAALGDFVLFSHGVDLAGISATAYVQAADTVEVRFQNESTTNPLDLASTTTRVLVIPRANLYEVFGGTVLQGATTFDPAASADGAGETATVTVGGAKLGDFCIASFSLDLQDYTVTSYVSAANTVKVRFQNEGGAAPNIASGTLRAMVIPRSAVEATQSQSITK